MYNKFYSLSVSLLPPHPMKKSGCADAKSNCDHKFLLFLFMSDYNTNGQNFRLACQ